MSSSADPDSVALVNFRGSSFQSSKEQETRETKGPEYLSPGKVVHPGNTGKKKRERETKTDREVHCSLERSSFSVKESRDAWSVCDIQKHRP